MNTQQFEGFTFMFHAMGQGDCTFIKCPDNRIVLIDCGMSSRDALSGNDWFTYAKHTLRSNEWAGKNHVIDAAILTHPDLDHYSKIEELVSQQELGTYTCPISQKKIGCQVLNRIDIKELYISMETIKKPKINRPDVLNSYGYVLFNNVGMPNRPGAIHEVTINSDKNFYKKWLKRDNFNKYVTIKIYNKELIILNGENSNKVKWKISIIAGNVDHSVDADTNAASLITLVQIGNKKALFTGDGTVSTLSYLENNHRDTIADLTLLTVPHHGSEYNYSEGFRQLAKPKCILNSSAFREYKYRHPSLSLLNNYFPDLEDTTIMRYYEGWKKVKYKILYDKQKKWKVGRRKMYQNNSGAFTGLLKIRKGDKIIAIYIGSGNKCAEMQIHSTKLALYTTAQGTVLLYMDSGGMYYT